MLIDSIQRMLGYMAIPDYQTCMLPFLRHLGDGKEHSLRDTEEALAEHFNLTPAERAELLPSAQQGIFKNRIGWARTYLKKAALIEAPKRAVFKITERGLQTLESNPKRIDARFLEQWPEFIEFRDISRASILQELPVDLPITTTTPEETIENAYQGLRLISILVFRSHLHFLSNALIQIISKKISTRLCSESRQPTLFSDQAPGKVR